MSFISTILDPNEDPLEPLGCVQEREWTPERVHDALHAQLSAGSAKEIDSENEAWEWTHFFGLFRSKAQFVNRHGQRKLRYQVFQTIRGWRAFLSFAALFLLGAGIIGTVLYNNFGRVRFDDISAVFGSTTETTLIAVAIFTMAALAYYYRGPSPTFDKTGLTSRYTTFSWMYYPYFIFGLGLVSPLVIPFEPWLKGIITIIIVFLFLTHQFAAGTFPKFSGPKANLLNADEPLIETPQPHLSIAIVAVLPAILTLVGSSIEGEFLTTPNGIDPITPWIVTNIGVPVGLTAFFCYWSYRILSRIQNRRIDPFQSRMGRFVVGGGFLVINFMTITFSTAIFSTLAGNLYPDLYRVQITLSPSGATGIGLLLSGLAAAAVVGAYIQSSLTDSTYPFSGRIRSIISGINYVILLGLFSLGGYVVTILIWSLIGTNPDFWDIPVMNLRIHYERLLLLTDVFKYNIIGSISYQLSEFGVALPVVLVAGLWAVYINRRLRSIVSETAHNPLALNSELIPDNIDVQIIDEPLIAQANGRVIRRSRVEIGRRFVETVTERASTGELPAGVDKDQVLEALIAHEVYHIENRDHIFTILAGIGSVIFGGHNVVLSFYDLAESERAADRQAASLTSREALRTALKIAINIKSDSQIDHSFDRPALLGNITTHHTEWPDIFSGANVGNISSRSLQGVSWLILNPYYLLFGSIITDATHLSYEDRQTILDLEDEIQAYVARQSKVKTNHLPTEYSYLTSVSREDIHAVFTERGATTEQIDGAIETLVSTGGLTMTDETYLRLS